VFGAVAALDLPADSTGAIERQWLASRVTRDTAAVTEAPTDTTGLTIYGLSMFRQKTSMFDPTAAGPVDESYVLGPGDQLVLILTGDVELAHSLEVTREGFAVIPQVGQLHELARHALALFRDPRRVAEHVLEIGRQVRQGVFAPDLQLVGLVDRFGFVGIDLAAVPREHNAALV
jgi:hypothetical protein